MESAKDPLKEREGQRLEGWQYYVKTGHQCRRGEIVVGFDNGPEEWPDSIYNCCSDVPGCVYTMCCPPCALAGAMAVPARVQESDACFNMLCGSCCFAALVCIKGPSLSEEYKPGPLHTCCGTCWSVFNYRETIPEYLRNYHATFRKHYNMTDRPGTYGCCESCFYLPQCAFQCANCCVCEAMGEYNTDLAVMLCPCTAPCQICRMVRMAKAQRVHDKSANPTATEPPPPEMAPANVPQV